ncbi:MAG: hypothetical protein J2P58_05775 [Acidimicrobiaceae bacterium]|nr:hypothetical protein [Acidimicrobiaceae bacterium]MBO0746907.1 hypothetical protein [Acidimicrobiaceae bacterium]
MPKYFVRLSQEIEAADEGQALVRAHEIFSPVVSEDVTEVPFDIHVEEVDHESSGDGKDGT